MPFDPPIDHAELCARVRFRLDEPEDLPLDELRARERFAAVHVAHLQGRGVRITPTLTPGLHAKLEEVRTRLLMPEAPAMYVHAHGQINATAFYGGNRCVMTATSSLINLLTLEEFGAILGHEIAHIGMRHAHSDDEDGVSRVFMLEQSRAAEVSCDRLAIIAAGKPRTAIAAMVKVVSGLDANHLTLDVDALLKQLSERPEEVDLGWEARETHPLLPFRIWALHRFAQTDMCRSLLGLEGGDPAEAVEDEICERFRAIGDGLTGRAVTDHLHEALVWTAALIINEDESHSDTEMTVLASVAGSVWAEDVVHYLRTHGVRAVERRAKDSLRALSGAGTPVRQRVQSHLDTLLKRLGAEGSRTRVEALLGEAWSDAKR
jgi:hypothetical protein